MMNLFRSRVNDADPAPGMNHITAKGAKKANYDRSVSIR